MNICAKCKHYGIGACEVYYCHHPTHATDGKTDPISGNVEWPNCSSLNSEGDCGLYYPSFSTRLTAALDRQSMEVG